MLIDPLARVDDGAKIGHGTKIGPFCFIGRDVTIGENCNLISHVTVFGRTILGDRVIAHPYSCLGGAPQSLAYREEPTTLVIGDDCVIRESVTINRGTEQGGGETKVGRGGYFMAYSHIAHDCVIGQNVILANSVSLAGHCIVGDRAFLSGHVIVHQFTRIGMGAMISGGAGIGSDIIPFGLAAGNYARLIGVNTIGMRRLSYSSETIGAVRAAYRTLFLADGSITEKMQKIKNDYASNLAVNKILDFIEERKNRPLCQPRIQS